MINLKKRFNLILGIIFLNLVTLSCTKSNEEKFATDFKLKRTVVDRDIPEYGVKSGNEYFKVTSETDPRLIIKDEKNQNKYLLKYRFGEDYDSQIDKLGLVFFTVTEGDCHACGAQLWVYDRNPKELGDRIVKIGLSGSWGTWQGNERLIFTRDSIFIIDKSSNTHQGESSSVFSVYKYNFQSRAAGQVFSKRMASFNGKASVFGRKYARGWETKFEIKDNKIFLELSSNLPSCEQYRTRNRKSISQIYEAECSINFPTIKDEIALF